MPDQYEQCACGCDETVPSTRVYRQGHDARHRDKLVDALIGNTGTRERARRLNALLDGLGINR